MSSENESNGTVIVNQAATSVDNVQVSVLESQTSGQLPERDITDVTPSTISAVSGASYAYYMAKPESNSTENSSKPVEPTGAEAPRVVVSSVGERWRDHQKPVHERHLKFYRILGILAIIAFFPTGIPAYITAVKLGERFYEGIQKGDMEHCNKTARLLEKLLIATFAFCLFTIILILALVGVDPGNRDQRGIHL